MSLNTKIKIIKCWEILAIFFLLLLLVCVRGSGSNFRFIPVISSLHFALEKQRGIFFFINYSICIFPYKLLEVLGMCSSVNLYFSFLLGSPFWILNLTVSPDCSIMHSKQIRPLNEEILFVGTFFSWRNEEWFCFFFKGLHCKSHIYSPFFSLFPYF